MNVINVWNNTKVGGNYVWQGIKVAINWKIGKFKFKQVWTIYSVLFESVELKPCIVTNIGSVMLLTFRFSLDLTNSSWFSRTFRNLWWQDYLIGWNLISDHKGIEKCNSRVTIRLCRFIGYTGMKGNVNGEIYLFS